MTIITKVFFSHPDMALADTITGEPDVSIRVVPEVGTDPEHDMYFILVEGDDLSTFESSLAADHTVVQNDLRSEFTGQRLYAVEFAPQTKLLAPRVTEAGGLSLEAKGLNDGWMERWQLPSREALHSIWQHARETSFTFEILELYRHDDTVFGGAFGLTDEQREALVMAKEHGYFQEPRSFSLSELAGELDISPTAASGRLRRGIDKLIQSTLIEEET